MVSIIRWFDLVNPSKASLTWSRTLYSLCLYILSVLCFSMSEQDYLITKTVWLNKIFLTSKFHNESGATFQQQLAAVTQNPRGNVGAGTSVKNRLKRSFYCQLHFHCVSLRRTKASRYSSYLSCFTLFLQVLFIAFGRVLPSQVYILSFHQFISSALTHISWSKCKIYSQCCSSWSQLVLVNEKSPRSGLYFCLISISPQFTV